LVKPGMMNKVWRFMLSSSINIQQSKGYTVSPVLIYAGELDSGNEEEDYFDRILNFDTLLSNP
jgi:hypothetical protein